MLNRLRAWWSHLRSSLWFVPTVIVLGSIVAAVALIESHSWRDGLLWQRWPRLFGADAAGSRAMLSAIATSMVTVAGVVFSITVVSLSLASSQYSPRVLRNFMSDRPTQVVLGAFVGVFAYCLVVLRTIRAPEDGNFIPAIAVLAGIAYAFLAIALLIYFIHHVADSIQASAIVARIASETAAAVELAFPAEVGEPPPRPDEVVAASPTQWTAVKAGCHGYLVRVDADGLLDCARAIDRVIRLRPHIGDFIAADTVIFDLAGTAEVDDTCRSRLLGLIDIGRQRTVDQDPAYGLQQLADVAVKALSPGINDPTTACLCIDRLGALLATMATRVDPRSHRLKDGQLRLIVPASGFGRLLSQAFGPVLQHCRGDVQVLDRLLDAIEGVSAVIDSPQRRERLAGELRGVQRALAAVRPVNRATASRRRARALLHALQSPHASAPA